MKPLFPVRIIMLATVLVMQFGALCVRSHAAPGSVDLSFNPGSGVNGQVTALVVQPDGKVIVGGAFTTVQGLARHGIARLNADGSGDSSFTSGYDAGFYGSPTVLALQPDGKILVGHYSGMLRLNGDGSLDNTFAAIITPYEEGVFATLSQPDGRVLIGGQFTAINGSNRPGIARLNTNGTLDTSFVPGAALQTPVSAMALLPDGKVIICGPVVVSGTSMRRIARLNANGSLDNTFNLQGSFGAASALVLQPDGKIVIGGHFSQANGAISDGIARLNSDGTPDASFNPGGALTGNFATGHMVNSLALQADGKIVVGGSFALNFPNWINVARFNADGTLDNSFNPGSGAQGSDYSSEVFAIAVQPDGRVLLGGAFVSVNGVTRNNLARLDTDGGVDAGFNHPGAQIDGDIEALLVQPDGRQLVGGGFNAINGFYRGGLARLHSDGSVDSTYSPALRAYSTVRSIARQTDGKLLITGALRIQPDPQPLDSIVRLHADGSWDSSFQPNLTPFIEPGDCPPGFSCYQGVAATSVLLLPDGAVLIAGHAQTTVFGDGWYYEVIRPFLARFGTDGILDDSFTSGANYSQSRMVLQPDGKIIVGGGEGISRLNTNGTADPSFNAGEVSGIRAIALQSDGKVMIGGGFYTVAGTPSRMLARLNSNGSLDGDFDPGTTISASLSGSVNSIALQPDGKIVLGGGFYQSIGANPIYLGVSRRNADGSVDPSFDQGTAWDGAVRSIALQPDGNIFAGGSFTTIKAAVRPRLARIYGDSLAPSFAIWTASFGLSGAAAAADADPDHDGVLNGVEYVLGRNPTAFVSSDTALPAVAVSGENLIFTFSRADATEVAGVALAVESGTDLVNWPAVFVIGATTATSSPGVTIAENGTAADTVTVAIPKGGAQAKFARLRVMLP